MPKRDVNTIDPILERTFGWLRASGFEATAVPDMTVGAAYFSDAVVVRPTYHWHDEFADVTIARRPATEPGPYWAEVHLDELLERAGALGTFDGSVRDESTLETVFARAAELLKEAARDQIAGRNLDLLDEIIASRPRRGVPGLDFPVTEPWASSQEGLWFATDFSGAPPALQDELAATRSPDARTRATAALLLHPGLADENNQAADAFGRLAELLADEDPDVRRAAASTLAEWRDPSVLDTVLALLDAEPGDAPSPLAASATLLAIGQPEGLRQRVREALDRFAGRGRPAARQAALLRWRLE